MMISDAAPPHMNTLAQSSCTRTRAHRRTCVHHTHSVHTRAPTCTHTHTQLLTILELLFFVAFGGAGRYWGRWSDLGRQWGQYGRSGGWGRLVRYGGRPRHLLFNLGHPKEFVWSKYVTRTQPSSTILYVTHTRPKHTQNLFDLGVRVPA
jgi:hypothetical protein